MHLVNFERSDGSTKCWLVNKFLLSLPDGEMGIATVYTDITERQEYERHLAESEERYGLASRHAGIRDWHLETNGMYISPAFARLVGWDQDKANRVTIKEINALIHEDDYAKHRQMLQAHIADSSVPYDIEHRFMMPDGRYRWFHVVGQSITDDDGRLVRMAGMITDIDSEHRTLEALRISEAQIATLLNNSPAPIYFKDKQSRFVMINQSYAEVYGIKMRLESELGKGTTVFLSFPKRCLKFKKS
ncbi:PAS domain S-box protein [Rhodospirillales bacterium]|nr:PAS domain S-box protein [Rhodospirillales bacterium]